MFLVTKSIDNLNQRVPMFWKKKKDCDLVIREGRQDDLTLFHSVPPGVRYQWGANSVESLWVQNGFVFYPAKGDFIKILLFRYRKVLLNEGPPYRLMVRVTVANQYFVRATMFFRLSVIILAAVYQQAVPVHMKIPM